MAIKEKTPLQKSNGWTANFNLVGEARINDYTYKMDQKSEKSDWIYNMLNLRVDCGAQHGVITSEMMGGYGAERENVVYVHGKDDNGNDDYKNQFTVMWDDRFNEEIIDTIGRNCFINVGLQRDIKGKLFVKHFITPYDAIAYINETLQEGMVISVRGSLEYSYYNGNIQCRKRINSIMLSDAQPENYKATFTQTVLADRDSFKKENIDVSTKTLFADVYVLEKFREFNGWDLTDNGANKGGIFVPLKKTFEFDLSNLKNEAIPVLLTKLLKVKKGVSQITFTGEFVESGATVQATEDDLTDDVKLQLMLGLISKEDALAICTANGGTNRRMIFKSVSYKKVENDDGTVTPVLQKFDEVYTDDDLALECLVPKEELNEGFEDTDGVPFDEVDEDPVSTEETDDLAALLASL